MPLIRKQAILLAVTAVVVASIAVPLILWVAEPGPQTQPSAPFVPLFQGDSSYEDEGCLTVRDVSAWRALWEKHTAGLFPQPSTPFVDFTFNMVLGCFLGYQSTTGSAMIEIVRIELTGTTYTAYVYRNYTQSDLTAISTPSHIVRAPLSAGPVLFVDSETGESIPEFPFAG